MKTLKTTIPEQYAQIDGKGYNMLEAELQKVYNDYPEYNDPELGGKGFMAMVKLFAEDDFYHEHYVARKYLELNEVFEQGRSAGRIEILEENLKRMQKSC